MQFQNILSEWGFCARKLKKINIFGIFPGTKIPFQGPKNFSKDGNGFPYKFGPTLFFFILIFLV
jgi:hypothetical protein